jgi:hypothetical protein
VRAYDADGMMVDAEVAPGTDLDDGITVQGRATGRSQAWQR